MDCNVWPDAVERRPLVVWAHSGDERKKKKEHFLNLMLPKVDPTSCFHNRWEGTGPLSAPQRFPALAVLLGFIHSSTAPVTHKPAQAALLSGGLPDHQPASSWPLDDDLLGPTVRTWALSRVRVITSQTSASHLHAECFSCPRMDLDLHRSPSQSVGCAAAAFCSQPTCIASSKHIIQIAKR